MSGPKVIKTDKIIACDVDDTLIHWNTGKGAEVVVTDENDLEYRLHVIQRHIDAIKIHKSRGHFVIVWSQGGYEWAAQAVKALGIEEYVDLCMCKPQWIIDDLPPGEWMKNVFIKETEE